MWQAIRLVLRALFRNRTFAAVSCITLAIGIGATATTFMLVHAVLIESMPYHDPAALVTIGGRMQRDGAVQQYPISYLDIQALATSDAFESIAGASSTRSFNLTANGEVEHLTGEMVGPTYASVLGVRTIQGRWFTEAENEPPDADRVVVLSYALWQRRFGSGAVLGTTLHLNETSYTVIGVAEEGFTGLSDNAEVWLPLGNSRAVYGAHYTDMRQFRWLYAVARLRQGVTTDQAQARIDALSTNLQREFVVDNANLSFGLTPIIDAFLGELRTPLLALFGAGVFVLLIAGTNVANLQLVRALSRRRELALRSALGATGGRLAGYAIVESVGLVMVSAAIGLALAQATVRVLQGTGSLSFASYITPRLHPLVVIVSVGIALACVLLTALMPALYAARTAPGAALGDGGKGSTIGRGHLRLQRGLVVFEVALALTLLTGAGLMVKGFSRFVSTDLGYKAENVLSARIDLTADRFKANENIWQVVRTLTTELRAIPGVNSVAAEGPGFPGSGWYQLTLLRDGIDTEENRIPSRRHHVTPGYLETMGIRLLAGRDLNTNDVAGAPLAIVVSERFAKRAWPDESAIGKRMLAQGGTTELTVVGVAADVQHSGLQTGDTPPVDVYISLYQSPPRSPSLVTFFLATQQAPNAIIPSLAPVLQRIDRDLAFYDVRSMTQRLRDQTSTGRLLMAVMLSFAFVGLGLAGLGVYGIIAYIAQLRTREVGIRVALGAEHGMVLREMMRQSVVPVLAGVLLGGASVVVFTRFLESLLYGVSPLDPTIVVSMSVALVAVAAAASWIPARRALRTEPVRSLRADQG